MIRIMVPPRTRIRSRSKIAVYSNDEHIDPVGSCVGQKGTRVNTITQELSGEKIDIIPWSEDPRAYVSNSLSPAKVISIEIDEKEHKAVVEVSDDQLSLAIGKSGQNVRLAAKLTGWRIDIKGDGKEAATAKADGEKVPARNAFSIADAGGEINTKGATEEKEREEKEVKKEKKEKKVKK